MTEIITSGLKIERSVDGDWILYDPASGFLLGKASWVLELPDDEGQGAIFAPAEANARLWAASSRLLAALEALISCMERSANQLAMGIGGSETLACRALLSTTQVAEARAAIKEATDE